MLLISYNEAKREFNNPSRMKKLYDGLIGTDESKKPKIIFMCTQHSKSKAMFPKHFQHVFGEYLEEKGGYKKIEKHDASFYIPGYKDNTSARTRIYTLKNNNPFEIRQVKFSMSDNMGKTSEGTKNRQGVLTSFTITNTNSNNSYSKKFNIINTELEKREGTKYDFKREGELAGLIKEFFKPTNSENFIICGSLYFNPHILDFISKTNIADRFYGNKLENYMNSERKKYDAVQEHMRALKINNSNSKLKEIINLVKLYNKFSESIKQNGFYNNCFGDEYDGYSVGQFVNNVQNFGDSVPTKLKGVTEDVRQIFRKKRDGGGGWLNVVTRLSPALLSPVSKFEGERQEQKTSPSQIPPREKLMNDNFKNANNKKMCNRILYALEDDDALQDDDNSNNKESIKVYNKKIGNYDEDTSKKASDIHAHKLIYKYFDL